MEHLLLSTAVMFNRTRLSVTFTSALLVLYYFVVAVMFSTYYYEQELIVTAKNHVSV